MRRILSCGVALLCGVALSAEVLAGDDSYPLWSLMLKDRDFERRYVDGESKIWSNSIQNDALTGDNITDQYFTNAIQLSAYTSIEEGFLFDDWRLYGFRCGPDDGLSEDDPAACESTPRLAVSNRDLKLVEYGYTMAHELYTPYQEAGEGKVANPGYEFIENAPWYDRPYAAWAYVGRTLKITGVDGYDEHQLTLGVVGPAAGGRWVQETAHQYPFSGAYPITGWETQVENRLAVQYRGKFARHWIHEESDYAIGYVSHYPLVEVGSILNRVGYGVEASLLVTKERSCRSYRSGDLFYLNTLAGREVAVASQLEAFEDGLRGYLDSGNRVAAGVRVRMEALLKRLEGSISAELSMAEGYAQLEYVQRELDELNKLMASRVVRACFPAGVYTRITAGVDVQYVLSNYLLEGGINVPAGADLSSSDPIMRNGGRYDVTAKHWIGSAVVGVMAGWKDHFGIGARYHYRTEETLEQMEQHRWAEFVIEGRSNWAAAFIPVLIGGLALARQDEWP